MKILELRVFAKEHSPDIILLQEIKLPPVISFKIPNHRIFRNYYNNLSSSRSIRGTAVCVKKKSKFFPANPARHLNIVVAIGVTIKIPATLALSCFLVYCAVNESP